MRTRARRGEALDDDSVGVKAADMPSLDFRNNGSKALQRVTLDGFYEHFQSVATQLPCHSRS